MISGRRAFQGETMADTMSAILHSEPPELIETNLAMPPTLERLVRHCLEKNAMERFQSARNVAFDLDTLISVSSTSKSGAEAIRTKDRAEGTVFVRDTDGSPPVRIGEGMGLAISPDGKWVITKPAKGGPLSMVPTGVVDPHLPNDPTAYAYGYIQTQSEAYLAKGLK